MASNKKGNQAGTDMVIARELINLMVIALEKKDCDIASSVEGIGRALERLGFFQNADDVYLPFSTTNFDNLISDYITEEEQGILEMVDEGCYKTDTKWGIPDVIDLESHALDLTDLDIVGQYNSVADYDQETKLDRKKAKKWNAKRTANEKQLDKIVEKEMKPIYDKLKEVEERNKKKFG